MTQRDRLIDYFSRNDVARAKELRVLGISAVAIARAVESGDILHIGHGLYQVPDVEAELHFSFAELAKRKPNGVICLMSALSFHRLTDQVSQKIWMAVGSKDWAPKTGYMPVRFARFPEPYFSAGVETREINGVPVKIYSLTKSLSDAFRNPSLVDRSVAIESLKSAMYRHRVTSGEIIDAAYQYGAGAIMAPYLEALVANG